MTTEKKASDKWRAATRSVRGGTKRSGFSETSEAIFMNSGYVYDSAAEAEASFDGSGPERFVYSRFANPTVAMFEERLALLEGAQYCRATASGMSAVWNALAACTKAGGRVVGSRALFGSCEFILTTLLPRFGVETELVDGTDHDAWEKALSKPADAVFLETPSNPTLEVIDIAFVSELAHKAGAKVVVDNVFATPILQHPFELGADVVVYSATKHIDGQGRCLGGAILFNDKEWHDNHLTQFLRHTGPSMSPFNAWTLLKGLETLNLRVDAHIRNATELANFLSEQPQISKVIYPGLASHPQHELAMKQMSGRGGGLIALELAGGKQAAFSLLDNLQLIDISNNLGDAKSLATHPWTTTHQRVPAEDKITMGITEGMLRLSVGLEDIDDLKEDLFAALNV
ncbi:O-succinylhomoserine sulfhydrylase [Thalassospira marina]|uniref:O-succinylhomoserine sulfhydrylase n=1 Tax=Thalassospira marina TaxID=2048283 RepID=A0A2N3KSM9_9PROT|nr:O-succinylhomoserine sulfhydrylase [Thalassospira marina]PKR53483.1 O-succinylhomoserine sulfhydrylase [Thalassospira marina]